MDKCKLCNADISDQPSIHGFCWDCKMLATSLFNMNIESIRSESKLSSIKFCRSKQEINKHKQSIKNRRQKTKIMPAVSKIQPIIHWDKEYTEKNKAYLSKA